MRLHRKKKKRRTGRKKNKASNKNNNLKRSREVPRNAKITFEDENGIVQTFDIPSDTLAPFMQQQQGQQQQKQEQQHEQQHDDENYDEIINDDNDSHDDSFIEKEKDDGEEDYIPSQESVGTTGGWGDMKVLSTSQAQSMGIGTPIKKRQSQGACHT